MKEREIRDVVAHEHYLQLVAEDLARLFPSSASFHEVSCPACASTLHAEMFRKSGFPYVRCADCGTLFVTPRPSREMLDQFYMASASAQYWVEHFFKPVAAARREKIFRPRAELVACTLANVRHEVVFEIGAGFGLFLAELRTLWPASRFVAVEPSADMAALCRELGLEVQQTTAENLDGWDRQVDVVTAFELIEHLYDPYALVSQARRLLRPGGHCVFTTLNGEGFDIQVLWEASRTVFPPHHLNFLNPTSLARLCARADLEVVEVTTPGRLDWDIVQQAVARNGAGIDRFWSIVAMRASETAKAELQSWISRHGLSSHMQVIARRPGAPDDSE